MKYLTTITTRSTVSVEADSVEAAEIAVRDNKGTVKSRNETYNTQEDQMAIREAARAAAQEKARSIQ